MVGALCHWQACAVPMYTLTLHAESSKSMSFSLKRKNTYIIYYIYKGFCERNYIIVLSSSHWFSFHFMSLLHSQKEERSLEIMSSDLSDSQLRRAPNSGYDSSKKYERKKLGQDVYVYEHHRSAIEVHLRHATTSLIPNMGVCKRTHVCVLPGWIRANAACISIMRRDDCCMGVTWCHSGHWGLGR